MKLERMGKYIAHRGLHDETAPENSIAAFEKAITNGLAIELDLRLSKDGRLVVFHDAKLKRMCSVSGGVKDYTYDELKVFRLKDSDEHIPLFADVLKLVNGRVPLLIELKNCDLGTLEKRTDCLLKQYKGDFAVQSFNIFTVLWFRLFSKDVKRGVLLSTHRSGAVYEYIARKITAQPIVWRTIGKPDFISVDRRSLSPKLINAAQKAGISLFVWTARDEKQLENASMAADAVIFEGVLPPCE